jgi:hypothetical protein
MGAHLCRQRSGVGRSNPWRTPRPGTRHHAAGLPLPPSPALDRGRADAEEPGRLDLAETGVDGAQQPLAEVDRVLLHAAELRTPSSLPQVALESCSVQFTSFAKQKTGLESVVASVPVEYISCPPWLLALDSSLRRCEPLLPR